LGGSYRLDENWTASASSITDFGEEPGLRRAGIGFAYADECFSFGIDGVRNLTNDAAGESESVLMMRIGLKNIGEFSAPEIAIRGGGAVP
jgi:LPS-assembly protein